MHVGDIGIGYFPAELDKFGNEQLAIISELRGSKSADNPVGDLQNTQLSSQPTNSSHINTSPLGGGRDTPEYTNSRDDTIVKDEQPSLGAGGRAKELGMFSLHLDVIMEAFLKYFNVDPATAREFASTLKAVYLNLFRETLTTSSF